MNGKTAAGLAVLSLIASAAFASRSEEAPPSAELIPVAGAQTLTFGAGAVWVTARRLLVRIDPATDAVVARIRLPGVPASAAVAGREVWVLTSPVGTGPSLLSSVDTATNRLAGRPIRLFPMAQGQIVAAGGSLWVTNDDHGRFGRVFRIDLQRRKLVGAVRIPDDPASAVFANGFLWVGESDRGKVIRVDVTTGVLHGRPIMVGGALLSLAADSHTVWVADSYSGRIVTIDAPTARVVADRPSPGVSWIAAAHGTVWTTYSRSGELAAFDAASARTTLAPLRLRGGAERVAIGGGAVWVVNALGLTRISSGPRVSAVRIAAFSLEPTGILFGLHPTAARIAIAATAASPLEVCQFGTSFAGRWKGGCRRLSDRPLSLPSTGGAVHVGVRVLPSHGRRTRVAALRIWWHCVDHYFALVPGRTHVRSASPSFDC